MKKFVGAAALVLGITGVAGSLWLIHQEYLVSRLFEKHSEQISDGRIAEELYDQESLLAWRDMVIHLSILMASLSMAYLGALRIKR